MALDLEAVGPGEFVCFDAGALIHFNRIGELERLGQWFPDSYTAEYVMREEIVAWKHKYGGNEAIENAEWLTVIDADSTEDAALMAQLSRRFERGGSKNIGELHVIALTARYEGTAIIEDAQARNAARAAAVKSTYWVSMLGAAVVSGLLDAEKAWDIQSRLEDGRDRSVIRGGEKSKFEAMVAAMSEWGEKRGWRDWPACLYNNGLDVIAVGAAKEQLGDPAFRKRIGLG